MEINNTIIKILDPIYQESKKPGTNIKTLLLKSFIAGQKYQEEKIRQGINIVFEELHNNNNKNN